MFIGKVEHQTEGRKGEREGGERKIFHLLIHSPKKPQQASLIQGQSQEPGVLSGASHTCPITHYLLRCIGRMPARKQNSQDPNWHSVMRCLHHTRCLNPLATTPAPICVIFLSLLGGYLRLCGSFETNYIYLYQWFYLKCHMYNWESSIHVPVTSWGNGPEPISALKACWAEQRPSRYLQVLAESATNTCFFPVTLLVMLNFFRWKKETQTFLNTAMQRASVHSVPGVRIAIPGPWMSPD